MKGLLLHKGFNSGKGFGVRLGANVNPSPPDIPDGAIQFEDSGEYIQFEGSIQYLEFEIT